MQTAKKNIRERILIFTMLLAIALTMAQLILIYGPAEANAQSLWENQTGMGGGSGEIGSVFGQTGDATDRDVRVVVAEIINSFLSILGIVFVILIIVAGYRWMTAGGNEENVNQAKSQITRAVIGLVIILLAWSITEFVTVCVIEAADIDTSIWYCP